jgi:trk system potassium uptake protein TrkH
MSVRVYNTLLGITSKFLGQRSSSDSSMSKPLDPLRRIFTGDSLKAKLPQKLCFLEVSFQLLGIAATVMRHGLRQTPDAQHLELGLVAIFAMLFLTVSTWSRYGWSLSQKQFLRLHRVSVTLGLLWLVGIVSLLIFSPMLPASWQGRPMTGWTAFILMSELLVIMYGLAGMVSIMRKATAGGTDPAIILVISFVVLIAVGTMLLMLPRARAETGMEPDLSGAPFLTALFTSTSAGCVTGLTVVPTGEYWSRTGQWIILCLFQIGGLGIMTFGAFFAVASGRGMLIRESATLRDLLESERLGDVRRLVKTILIFTVTAELVGAVLMSGLWSQMPTGEQFFYSLFHSVSAFCNAGFSLTENSFVGMGTRWEIWGVASGLIIVGGLGFAVIYNMMLAAKVQFSTIRKQPLFHLPRHRVRLSLSTKLVLTTTAGLLLFGTLGLYLLESTGPHSNETTTSDRMSAAWFQSVTFRTAGFNTVDHGELQPATKLFAIGMMFIGASPGSTGGGVKTVCFALMFLSLLSVLRGRHHVEIMGRRIPSDVINRSLTIITLGMIAVMTATLLLVLFENRPGHFIDHMFEATSAFATVGVSSSVEVQPGQFLSTTQSLSTPSQWVIVVTMFLGRVGPLTLLIALAGRMQEARYEYPVERVTLG